MNERDEFEPLTGSIIGCAFKVYNEMGFGYLEKVYERCMLIELGKAGHTVASQYPIRIDYAGECVGEYVADILVEKACIVELKSSIALHDSHNAQLVNYLKSTGKPVGLLLNFGPERVDVVRRTGYWKPPAQDMC